MSRFDRSQRLLTPHQFQRVFRKSRRFADDMLMLRVRYHDDPEARLGLAISKKHARLAVQRNRIKRHVREVFRELAPELARGDYVVLNRPPAANASGKRLQRSVRELLVAAKTRKKRE